VCVGHPHRRDPRGGKGKVCWCVTQRFSAGLKSMQAVSLQVVSVQLDSMHVVSMQVVSAMQAVSMQARLDASDRSSQLTSSRRGPGTSSAPKGPSGTVCKVHRALTLRPARRRGWHGWPRGGGSEARLWASRPESLAAGDRCWGSWPGLVVVPLSSFLAAVPTAVLRPTSFCRRQIPRPDAWV
jgi:hypothetical protein